MLCEYPILRLPNFDQTFVLRTDAEAVGLVAMLMLDYDEHAHIIA